LEIIPIPNKKWVVFYLELEWATGCRAAMRSIARGCGETTLRAAADR
jgi:hypothetical protein